VFKQGGPNLAEAVFRYTGKYRVFFEKPVFRFCESPSTEKPKTPGKRQRTGKKQDKNASVSANPS
jgi:hypothetical protein